MTRELFHLLMERLKSQIGGALEGQVGHLVLIHDLIIYSIVWGLVCSGGKNNTACNIEWL